jgi:hypothetical protein
MGREILGSVGELALRQRVQITNRVSLVVTVWRWSRLAIADMGVLEVAFKVRIGEHLFVLSVPRGHGGRDRTHTPEMLFVRERESKKVTREGIRRSKRRGARIDSIGTRNCSPAKGGLLR